MKIDLNELLEINRDTPGDMRISSAGLNVNAIVIAMSWLWEREIHTPAVVINPRGLSGIYDDPNFTMSSPTEWEMDGSLRGTILDCEVHAFPELSRKIAIVFGRMTPEDPIETVQIYIVSTHQKMRGRPRERSLGLPHV